MENASKALLIVGGLLIILAIISITMMYFTSSKGMIETSQEISRSELANIFNSEFRVYEGRQTAYIVKELLIKVKSYNNNWENEHNQIEMSLVLPGPTTITDINSINSKINVKKTYLVEMQISTDQGKIANISITQN